VQDLPGTPYGLMIMGVMPTVSGPGIAAMVAGIASIMVTVVELCFGLVGSADGWGTLVAGAFAVLAGALSVGAIGLGTVSLRQIRQARETVGMRGRGQALTGVICGAIGLTLTIGILAVSALLTAAGRG
jgi:hypothetical protein